MADFNNKKKDNNKKKKNTSLVQKIKSNKNKEIKKRVMVSPSENPKYGYCEYVMSPECATDILATRNKSEQKGDPQQYLCNYVNEQYGLMGYCTVVKY